MLLLDLSNCGPSGLLRVLYFFKLILDIVFIIIPIGLIILLTIDFAKAVISGDESAQKKTFNLATKRIMYAVIVFFVPTIVSIVNTVLGNLGVDYSVCYNDISLDAINTLEAEEMAKEEAEKAARLALLGKERLEEEGTMDSDGYYVGDANKSCDGMVYYENGTFYTPGKSYKNGTPETKGSALHGYNKLFYNMLNTMISDAKKAGHTITMGTGSKAWRSFEKQEELRDKFENNGGNTAAKAGTSKHGWGIASDLSFGDMDARVWAHQHAEDYDLTFSVCNSYKNRDKYNLNDSESRKKYFDRKNCDEAWHIQPESWREDNSVVEKCS